MADKKGLNPAATALTGAIIGAAAGAAAIALSDEKNRKKLGKKVSEYSKQIKSVNVEDLKARGQKALTDFKKKASDLRNKAADGIEEGKKETQQKLEENKSRPSRAAAA